MIPYSLVFISIYKALIAFFHISENNNLFLQYYLFKKFNLTKLLTKKMSKYTKCIFNIFNCKYKMQKDKITKIPNSFEFNTRL